MDADKYKAAPTRDDALAIAGAVMLRMVPGSADLQVRSSASQYLVHLRFVVAPASGRPRGRRPAQCHLKLNGRKAIMAK